MWGHLWVERWKGHPKFSSYPLLSTIAPSYMMGTWQVSDKHLCNRINAEILSSPKVGDDHGISVRWGLAACNVSLTSLEIQPPSEEGTRGYKIEIEGESLQRRGQSTSPSRDSKWPCCKVISAHTPGPVMPACGRPPGSSTQASGHLRITGKLGYSAST